MLKCEAGYRKNYNPSFKLRVRYIGLFRGCLGITGVSFYLKLSNYVIYYLHSQCAFLPPLILLLEQHLQSRFLVISRCLIWRSFTGVCKLDPIFGTLTHGHVSLQEQHLPVEHIPFWLCTMLSNIDCMTDTLKMFGDSVLRFSVLNTNV